MAKCVCDSIECTSDNEKVCGEDGQTYASRCDLMRLSCLKQTTIEIAHLGQCSQGKLYNSNLNVSIKVSINVLQVYRLYPRLKNKKNPLKILVSLSKLARRYHK